MYIGPQQGQFWQHVLAAFFLKGQCSWMKFVKHFNLRISNSLHFPDVQPHFLVFVVQATHAVCGDGMTWEEAVGVDQP